MPSRPYTYTTDVYKINLVGLLNLAASFIVYAGALGGTDFERGVAGMLIMLSADVLSLYREGSEPWLRFVVTILLPIALGSYAWGLYLVLSGMS